MSFSFITMLRVSAAALSLMLVSCAGVPAYHPPARADLAVVRGSMGAPFGFSKRQLVNVVGVDEKPLNWTENYGIGAPEAKVGPGQHKVPFVVGTEFKGSGAVIHNFEASKRYRLIGRGDDRTAKVELVEVTEDAEKLLQAVTVPLKHVPQILLIL